MLPLDLPLQGGPEARDRVGAPRGAARARPRVPELDPEPTQVVALVRGPVVEARHVDVLAPDPAVVPGGGAVEEGQGTPHVDPDLLAEVAADHVGAVAEPVGMTPGLRVEEEARGVHAA